MNKTRSALRTSCLDSLCNGTIARTAFPGPIRVGCKIQWCAALWFHPRLVWSGVSDNDRTEHVISIAGLFMQICVMIGGGYIPVFIIFTYYILRTLSSVLYSHLLCLVCPLLLFWRQWSLRWPIGIILLSYSTEGCGGSPSFVDILHMLIYTEFVLI